MLIDQKIKSEIVRWNIKVLQQWIACEIEDIEYLNVQRSDEVNELIWTSPDLVIEMGT